MILKQEWTAATRISNTNRSFYISEIIPIIDGYKFINIWFFDRNLAINSVIWLFVFKCTYESKENFFEALSMIISISRSFEVNIIVFRSYFIFPLDSTSSKTVLILRSFS